MQIGVIGLGYVGLPLAVVAAEAGHQVIGFEINQLICDEVNKGKSHIKDIDGIRLKNLTKSKKLKATSDFKILAKCDVISICVPTPLNKVKDPDLSFVIKATEAIALNLSKGQLVILESTTYPGTTKELMLPILEKSGFKVGVDFFLCFSPERVDPGNVIWHTKNTPKILGGVTESCKNEGINVYKTIFEKVISVQNTQAAELVKVYENTFRMINIALANELSQICDKLDLNVWEIIDAAASKPFGFMKFTPGPGLGGHCIPLDPHYLSWKMRQLSFETRMIDLASDINAKMPIYIVNKVGEKLNYLNKAISSSNILIIGVAYKKNIDDMRESPAVEIFNILKGKGAEVNYHDNYCPKIIIQQETIESITLNKNNIKSADMVLILTDHDYINYELINSHANLIVDTRGVMKFQKV